MTTLRGVICVCAASGAWGCRDKEGDSGSPPITDDSGGEITTFEGDVDSHNMGEVCADAQGLVEVEGYVMLRSSDLSSLSALSCVSSISETLTIEGTALTTLAGLEQLTEIGGDLEIQDNTALSSLEGLEGLRTVGAEVRVSGNAVIADLRGLSSLERVGETLSFGRCWDDGEGFGLICGETGNVASLEGLEQLREVGGGLMLVGNTIPDLDPLSGLSQICEDDQCEDLGALLLEDDPALENMRGLRGVSMSGPSARGVRVHIRETGLTSLEGLENFTTLGQLTVQDNPDLTDLTGLSGLTELSGWLKLSGNGLTSLHGLESLGTLWTLELAEEGVVDLQGLSGLTQVGGRLYILYTRELISLDGLENLVSVGEWIWLEGNEALSDISALSNITTLQGGEDYDPYGGGSTIYALVVLDNPALTSLHGLESITELTGDVHISGVALEDLGGLAGLVSVGGNLYIYLNDVLPTLAGLEQLRTIEASLVIAANAQLYDVSALYGLEEVGSSVQLCDNPELAVEDAQALIDEIESIGHTATICE